MKMVNTVPESSPTQAPAPAVVEAQPEPGSNAWNPWVVRVIVLSSLVLCVSMVWNKLSTAEFVQADAVAVPVPRAQGVAPLPQELRLRIGDVIVLNDGKALITATIKGLPMEHISLRDPHTGGFMVLGANRYYVVCSNGDEQIVPRARIRGLVWNRAAAHGPSPQG